VQLFIFLAWEVGSAVTSVFGRKEGSSMMRTMCLAFAGLLVGVTGLAGPAGAADVFQACSKDATSRIRPGSIFVNATPACRSTETLRSWNEVGPPGPSGPPGPAGPSDAFSTFGEVTPLHSGGVFLTLAQLSLPSGNYVVTAKATLVNSNAAITAIPYCAIIRGPGFPGLNDQTLATINGAGAAALTAVLPVTLPTANVVRFMCTNNTLAGSDGDLEAEMVTMVAIRVGTLTAQGSPSGAFVD
jgi:hypothetical protein